MKVCIIHYHYRTGGVTSVVRNASRSLLERGHDVCVVSGEVPKAGTFDPAVRVVTVEGLGYADEMNSDTIHSVSAQVFSAVGAVFPGGADVWHVHNHTLGKGPGLLALVLELTQRKEPLVLQLHDFAEDGRPGNYRRLAAWEPPDGKRLMELLYPQNGNVTYALLNGRDRRLLEQAGCRNCILLPNAVDAPERNVASDAKENIWIYPTRAIRRKNIGEFILHAALSRDDALFAVTRAPQNPEQKRHYDPWVAFAERESMNVCFDYGSRVTLSFEDMLAGCRGAVTTSVAEGFGLAYLEPWLLGCGLAGRDLQDITSDFKADGVSLDHLYDRLDVPLAWVGEEHFRMRLRKAMSEVYAAYDCALSDEDVERAYHAAVSGDAVDFGRLDEDLQRQVIGYVLRDAGGVSELRHRMVLDAGGQDAALIRRNAEMIRRVYNLDQYGERLENMYVNTMLGQSDERDVLAPQDVLQGFLKPERFSLLRC